VPTAEIFTTIFHRRISNRLTPGSLVSLHRRSIRQSARTRSNAAADLLILRSCCNNNKAFLLLLDVRGA
jgi:hypothetical protein